MRVARNGEPGVSIEQTAKDLGVHLMTLAKWMCRADIDEGAKPGPSRTGAAQIRELTKRNRILEQDNEVLRRCICRRRTCRQKFLPACGRARRYRNPCDGDVPGAQALPPALPPVAG